MGRNTQQVEKVAYFLPEAAPHLGHQLLAHGLKQASWTLVIGIGQR